MNRIVFRIAVLCAAVVLSSSAATAEVINIDLGTTVSPTYIGTAAAPDLGTVWNGIPTGEPYPAYTTTDYTTSSLVDSNGNSVPGVSLTVSTDPAGDGFYADGAYSNSDIAPDLMEDYIFAAPHSIWATFDGLTPGSLYDVYVYSDTGVAWSTDFTIVGAGAMPVLTVSNVSGVKNSWVPGENYSVANGVEVSATGQIRISAIGSSSASYAIFNAVQLVAVPEPSILALFATGLIGLLAIWRKRM